MSRTMMSRHFRRKGGLSIPMRGNELKMTGPRTALSSQKIVIDPHEG